MNGQALRANLVNTTSYLFSASADAGSAGIVSETISTTPGTVYEISFLGNISQLYIPTEFNFSFGNTFNQQLLNDLGHHYYQWYLHQADTSVTPFTFLATADSASTALCFQYVMTTENYGMSIRNLKVNAVPDGTSTAALFALAGTGLALVRRWHGN